MQAMTPGQACSPHCWVFDLDNTLYPPSMKLFPQIEVRMEEYMCRNLQLDPEKVPALRNMYWREYGTTLMGLMREHNIDPDPFLDYVHDIKFEALETCAQLRRALQALPGRKIIYTNGTAPYARNVLRARGIDDVFDAVFGVEDANYISKPHREAFETVFAKAGLDPRSATMFEDEARNLIVPHEMGLKTVWVTENVSNIKEHAHIDEVTSDLASFLTARLGRKIETA